MAHQRGTSGRQVGSDGGSGAVGARGEPGAGAEGEREAEAEGEREAEAEAEGEAEGVPLTGIMQNQTSLHQSPIWPKPLPLPNQIQQCLQHRFQQVSLPSNPSISQALGTCS